MANEVSAMELVRLRLRTQRLEGPSSPGVADTVRHMLALQAQDFAQAIWAVGVRTPGSTRTSVLAALQVGEVVRTLPMRGTLHFIPAEDLRWMLDLTAARTLQGTSTRFRTLGLDQETLDRAETFVTKALEGGGSLSRDEFTKLLDTNGISPGGQRAYNVIFYLCQRQVVCWGPPRGTQQALVLVDEWITSPRRLERAEALREFAVRYFTGHGPASLRDFAWWTKLTLRDARAAIESASDILTPLEFAGSTFWIATSELSAATAAPAKRTLHALPGFDEYLLGYQDRSLILPDAHVERIVPGNNGIFLPIIVSRGEIVGTWRRGRNGSAVEPHHFVDASAAQLVAFERAARGFETFAAG